MLRCANNAQPNTMTTKLNPTIAKAVELLQQNYFIKEYMDVEAYIDEDISTLEELEERLQEAVQETEMIYYSRAIKFLMEEDCGLNRSIEIADSLGFQTKDLNSELLATLLLQEILNEEIYDVLKEARQIEEETQQVLDN